MAKEQESQKQPLTVSTNKYGDLYFVKEGRWIVQVCYSRDRAEKYINAK